MFFNGIIKFYQNNCLVLVVISLIQITDIRISSQQFSIAERFCSILAIIVLILSFLLPVVVLIVYVVKIGKSNPLPDLNDYLQVEELKYIYGTIDFNKVQKAYTKYKHTRFMARYGILLDDVRLSQLGKAKAIFVVIILNVRQLVLSVGIVYLRQRPVFLIYLFNFTSLAILVLYLSWRPYEDNRMVVF